MNWKSFLQETLLLNRVSFDFLRRTVQIHTYFAMQAFPFVSRSNGMLDVTSFPYVKHFTTSPESGFMNVDIALLLACDVALDDKVEGNEVTN